MGRLMSIYPVRESVMIGLVAIPIMIAVTGVALCVKLYEKLLK